MEQIERILGSISYVAVWVKVSFFDSINESCIQSFLRLSLIKKTLPDLFDKVVLVFLGISCDQEEDYKDVERVNFHFGRVDGRRLLNEIIYCFQR